MQMNQDDNMGDFPGFDATTVHFHMLRVFADIYTRYGSRCSESLYHRAIVRRAYLDKLPIMSERELFVDFGEGSLLVGRVDLEVAGNCLYELKIGTPNIAKDSEQIKRYLYAYDNNKEKILIASLVYFTTNGVVVHDIRNWTKPQGDDDFKSVKKLRKVPDSDSL
jgi:hypothetical protein